MPLLFCAIGLDGALLTLAADEVRVIFPEPASAAFASSEMSAPVRIENRGGAAVDAKFLTRLWQLSSATAVPLDEAAPWWNGHVEPGAVANANVKLTVPDFRTATRLRLQILGADGAPVARLEWVAIPKTWLRDEIAALPGLPGLFDPARRLAPAFAKLGIEFTPVEEFKQLGAFAGPVMIVVAPDHETTSSAEAAQRLTNSGRGVVFVGDAEEKLRASLAGGVMAKDTDFCESASAQFQFVQWLRAALRRKTTNVSNSVNQNPP